MKKVICFCFFFFTSVVLAQAKTTMNYDLQIKNDKIFNEKIVFNITDYKPINNGEDINAVLINQDIYSDKYRKIKYEKTISKNGNNYAITLSQTYNEYQFKNSYILKLCFEDFDISYSDTYYQLKINSKNYCNFADQMNVKITSDYQFVNSNGSEVSKNTYEWTLNDKAKINFRLSKKTNQSSQTNPGVVTTPSVVPKKDKDSSITNYIFFGIIILIIVVAAIVIYRIYKVQNEKNNKI